MSELVERVAKAIFDVADNAGLFPDQSSQRRSADMELARQMARAAIGAIEAAG